jgi:hypothetical protein
MTVLDRSGRTLAREHHAAEGKFFPMAAAQEACLAALAESFAVVSKKGVQTLDGF